MHPVAVDNSFIKPFLEFILTGFCAHIIIQVGKTLINRIFKLFKEWGIVADGLFVLFNLGATQNGKF